MLPYFKKAENWEGEETEVHGKGGPLFTSKMDRSPLCAAVIEAGKELGLEYREDVNDLPLGAGDAIAWCQQTRGGRRRASTARTYLRPALKRPNLELVTKAQVRRILFDGARAIGVEYSRGGTVEHADAGREVILSAGAIGSPHILQLSGVGAPAHLDRVGIPVHHRSARGRAQHAGPLHRPDQLPGQRGPDGQRALARAAAWPARSCATWSAARAC